MSDNKWVFKTADAELQKVLSEKFNVSAKLAAILLNRNITPENAQEYLNASYESLYNPFLFKDMHKAALRLREAIDKNEKILVYGDRDVDGITAVNVLALTIKKLGGTAEWYVPFDEGYGISREIIDSHVAQGIRLIVTVDCGISAAAEIDYARAQGADIIITDHHEPPQSGVPDAYAVINPKTLNSGYPFEGLAGCSVALKLAEALMLTFGKDFDKKIFFVGSDGQITSSVNGIATSGNIENNKNVKVVASSAKVLEDIAQKYPAAQTEFFCYEKNLMQEYLKHAASNDGRMKQFFDDNSDVVALGTIADIVPLVNENRILVKEGLKNITKNIHRRPGLGFIVEDNLTSKNAAITARAIAWNVTPVLNSAGRMGKAVLACELLMEFNEFKAKNAYADILKLNDSRKDLQAANALAFSKLVKEQTNTETDKVLIVCAKGLEHGVTGIVAAQLVRLYAKPVILLISEGGEAVGAARSIAGFDIVGALESVKDILVKYGGHAQAAGFTVKEEYIEQFKTRVKQYAEKFITSEMTVKTISVDAELKISDLNMNFYSEIQKLEPFGMGNPQPNFCIKNAAVTEISSFGTKREHLKFKVSQQGSHNVAAVYWNAADIADIIKTEKVVDMVFNLELNRGSLQLVVADLRPAMKK
jgi:single-stranded-DNA-specific exonuclease